MMSRVGETVNKMAYKMEEMDPWFQERTLHVEQMENQLRKLFGIVVNVLTCRWVIVKGYILEIFHVTVQLLKLSGPEGKI
jgi:hypothetical protein